MKRVATALLILATLSYLYHANLKDMVKIGEKYGLLTVRETFKTPKAKNTNHNNYYAVCLCDCGYQTEVLFGNLKSGHSKSCGCASGRKTHGMSDHPLSDVRTNMLTRCNKPSNKAYKHYGGRGIKVCDEWTRDANSFIQWSIKNGWKENLTLDRIDNNGHYEPSNCRYITRAAQQVNKRRVHLITVDGVTKTLSQWANFYGLSPATLGRKYRAGIFISSLVNPKFRQ